MGTSPSSPNGPTGDATAVGKLPEQTSAAGRSRSPSEIVEAAHASLLSWRGWSRIEALLASRPEMDLYLAGGALRNVVFGDDGPPIKDFDFFLDEQDLEPVAEELGHYGRIERTVFRLPRWYPEASGETYCDLIAIQRFETGILRCNTILDVLQVFDFTANALALDVRRGSFFDPVGGTNDIRSRTMRAVRLDHPSLPLVPGHDLTRPNVIWLRLVHYTAKLGLEIEPETLGWLRANAHAWNQRARYEEVLQPLHPRVSEVLERYGLG